MKLQLSATMSALLVLSNVPFAPAGPLPGGGPGPYIIEPPDVLVIDAQRLRSRPPYLEPLGGLANKQIGGEHLVALDGTILLGAYGHVNVAGLTPYQAGVVLERYLSRWFLNPDLGVSVNGDTPKYYHIVFDGGGYGQQIIRLPITGKETVLDAIANVVSLPRANRRKIWVARPAANNTYQILPVDWHAITTGNPETNWQLFAGDRIYVAAAELETSNPVRMLLNAWSRWREPPTVFGF